MRPIDADEISKKAAELSRVYRRMYRQTKDNVWASRSDAVDHVMEMIYEAPTIEAEPVKRGRWIHHAGMNSKCSCCGRYFPVAEFEQRPFDVNFCSHCGAKMDGGDHHA